MKKKSLFRHLVLAIGIFAFGGLFTLGTSMLTSQRVKSGIESTVSFADDVATLNISDWNTFKSSLSSIKVINT